MSSSCRRLTLSHSQLSCLTAPKRYYSSRNVDFSTARFLYANQQGQFRRDGRRQFSSVHDIPSSPSHSSASHVQSHSYGAGVKPASNEALTPPPPLLPLPQSFSSSPAGSARSPLDAALSATAPRMDWAREDIGAIYETPLMELAYFAVSGLSFSLSRERVGLFGISWLLVHVS